jgi:5-methyltetrahydrofolate--homocysteine methyltransferase
MKKLSEFLQNEILVLDGAMGTNLAALGFEGVPEAALFEAEDLVFSIHRSFLEAGSQAVETNTFGANRIKLKKFGLDKQVAELNEKAVKIARRAVGDKAFVFGSIGPTGLIPEPVGSVSFDFLYDVFSEQAAALARAGVDALILETFIDIQEARIAALAALETTDLPVFVTLTFNDDLKTDISATTPEAAVGILEPLGVAGVGANCSLGPSMFVRIVDRMGKVAEKNTVFQPNAGLPEIVEGATVYKASPEEYREFALRAIEAGAGILGGCCGSKPEHIAAIRDAVKDKRPLKLKKRNYFYLCTPSEMKVFDLQRSDFLVIGERLNPTNRKDLEEDLRSGAFEVCLKEAQMQENAGAHILDVNTSLALLDETETLKALVGKLAYSVSLPLSIDTTSRDALEAALKIYPGRPLINSINAKEVSCEEFLKLARRFGAPFIALALSDKGVAKKAEEKVEVLKTILKAAEDKGFSRYDLLFDPVVLSAATTSVKETLKAVKELSREGFYTVFGLSNVSHGLPERKYYNRAFAVLAAADGLSGAIIDPLDQDLIKLVKAARFLVKLTTELLETEEQEKQDTNTIQRSLTLEEELYHAIISGQKEKSERIVADLLKEWEPYAIISQIISPAMNEVGQLFQNKKIFLPQVLLAAEAVKKAFGVLRPRLLSSGGQAFKARVILATVEGDVHDIGKNIVGTVLEASGYEVIDLGVDVSPVEIVEAVERYNPKVVGLSCLMTTTLPSLEKTVKLLKSSYNGLVVAIGGAVVTEAVKEAYGADIYAKDAMGFLEILERELKN